MTTPDSTGAAAPGRLDALVAQANSALASNDSAAALALSRAALRIDPDHDPALEAAWRASMLAQRWDWALVVGERWCRIHPHELGAWQACLVPQLLLHETAAFDAALRSARQRVGPHPLLATCEALLLALVGDDSGSARVAATLTAPELHAFTTALLGPAAAALVVSGWQSALLRAFLLYEQQMAGVWAGRDALVSTLQTLSSRPMPCVWQPLRYLSLLFSADESAHVALVDRMADAWPRSATPRSLAADARLRVGYLSQRMGAHATLVLMGGIPAAQDHRRFELFAYGFAPGRTLDPAELLVQGCDTVRGLPADATQAADIIARDRIDVLIVMPDWDMDWLATVCRASTVPVVISYLSFCSSTGGLAHYRIADDSDVACDPPAREATIRWRGSAYAYSAAAIDTRTTRHEHGLADDAVVVSVFNGATKIGPALAAAWARLLLQVPAAVLWLHQTHPLQATLWQAWFAAQGIAPGRLVFAASAGHAAHLARSALADLYLDAWDYNGHTSILDTLCAGVPVVTLEGTRVAQRIGATLLRQHGAGRWVAHNAAEYERHALTLMQSGEARRAYRAQLAGSRAQFSPFQIAAQARRLDATIVAAQARHAQGLPPADITID
ncbi:MAG: hypothetical protein ABI671_16975 [Burkholderiales bacterium]